MRLAFRERPWDLIGAAGASLVAVGVIAAGGANPLRFLLGVLLVLFLPGYVIAAAVFPRAGEVDWIERIAISFGLSLAIVPLVGLALNATPAGVLLGPAIASLLLVTLGMAAVAYWRRMAVLPENRLALSLLLDLPKWGGLPTFDKFLAIGAASALVVGAAAWGVSSSPPGAGFTECYLLDAKGEIAAYERTLNVSEPSQVELGIANREHRDMNYTVEVWLLNVSYVYNDTTKRNDTIVLNSTSLESFPVNVTDGHRKEVVYQFSIPRAGDYLLRFLLFVPTQTSPYRLVQLQIHVV